MMNVLLIPLMLASLVNQIQLSDEHTITATILTADSVIDMNYLALTPDDFTILKSIVESTDNRCSKALVESISLCKYQLEACHSTCNSIPAHQKQLIQVLKNDANILKVDVRMLEKQNKILKYTAIIASSIAISSGAYIMLK